MSAELLAILLGVVVCGAGGLAVPALVRRIPEPADAGDTEPEDGDPEDGRRAEDKEPYASIAALRGLGPAAAVACAVLGGVTAAAIGLDPALAAWLYLVPVGVALAVVDWRTLLLPTAVIKPSYAVVVVLVLAAAAVERDPDDLVRAGLGWLVAGAVYGLLWFIHPRGLGYGDVRLSGVLGIALGQLGWAELVVGVYAGFLLGGVVGGLLSALRVVRRTGYPFGPFMLLGAVVGVVTGPSVLALAG